MKKIIYLFLLLFIVNCNNTYSSRISVTPITLTEQLPSNSVQRLYQDKEGFMWLATLDGLCRYDGYQTLVFRSNLNSPQLLTNNEITCLSEDTSNRLWIGTKKGMNILDKSTYQISHFDGQELANQEIRCITTTSDSSIWVGTNRQMFRFNPDMTLRKKYDSSLPIGSINSVYEDLDGNIWVTTWRNGLHKYDKEKDTFKNFPGIGNSNNPFKVFQDSRKQLWICTWGDGIFLFNPNESENGQAMYKPIEVYSLGRNTPELYAFSIEQDDIQEYIWIISTAGMHAMKYTDNGDIEQDVEASSLFNVSNNIFSEVIKDHNGNLWIGTFSEGVLTVSFNKPVIENYSLQAIKDMTGITPNITSIYQDKDNDLWIAQNRWGLGLFDPQKNKVSFFRDNPELRSLPGLNLVNCISSFRSRPEEVWVGTQYDGLIYRMKKKNGNISLLSQTNLYNIVDDPGQPLSFFEDRKNNIWIVTSTKLIVLPYNKDNAITLPLNSITGITEDTKGSVWVSSRNSGIYHIPIQGSINIDGSKIINYSETNGNLISNNITSICGDINGKVWIGTKEGNIITYDILEQRFTDNSDLFKILNEGILNIISDDFGHIWISTNKRIIEYNPVNKALRSYSSTDGVLVNSFLENSYLKTASGKILFGGNKGISVFTASEKLSEHPKDAKPLVIDVKINNKSVFRNNDNHRFDVISQTLVLEPGDKNIEINFSSLDYIYPTKIQYAYKMDGIDDGWVYNESDRQFAIYNQLEKGNHKFYIRSTDENGLWSDNITLLKIYKRPAFYETWWAYMIYTLIIIILIYITYRTAINRIKLRNELKIAQIEKDKSEELTQSKLRYFTNISHDFLTPLTIISCLIDDIEMTYKGKIGQFEIMRSNVNRLKRLLQQVLDFRKVESGRMKLQISYGNIVTFIKDVCDTHFMPLVKKKNINFSFVSENNQIQAYFDADKVDKVIFNLLSNAFKYTPNDGEIKVELKQETKKDNQAYIVIKISDTGVGISQSELDKIFVRFYSNSSDRQFNDSNGIGLSLTKDLIDLHNGTINVESEVNVGTTFTVELPIDEKAYNVTEVVKGDNITILDKEELPAIEEEGKTNKLDEIEAITENTEAENTEKEQTTVLLVEDNEELLTLMKNILIKSYNIFTATNGIEALSSIKENSIDIVISDVMMPEMDGLELCRTLKSNLETSHIPIILLTAKNSADDRIACYNAGADAYISKPFELKVLAARIHNFIVNKKDKQKEFKSNVEINISTLDYQSSDEQFLNNAISIIERKLSDTDLDVNLFAQELNMSKSSLYRKIKTMTGLSPNEFIRNIRLKHACQMLRNPSVSISEVAYSVGFSDPKYFTLCFKNEFDVTPREYQRSL
ncbi:hybrid sensor histidine kinase/response regulator [Dysgonomonas sp. 216]|uniref:hybrid sensor histidine kinase/response regulator transcription factor n=1 Tax=Dysgonomonas sp. 216 TaxID=2302934 RepID=UPI0013D6B6F6|nr:hybrid sensor histidine kinase/response regulator transcription factor [Dysgonomonas sp. 216]NDW19149.1 hybrid sensor histidine kinase/response regulator [Dysgonomonas sp. 216]